MKRLKTIARAACVIGLGSTAHVHASLPARPWVDQSGQHIESAVRKENLKVHSHTQKAIGQVATKRLGYGNFLDFKKLASQNDSV